MLIFPRRHRFAASCLATLVLGGCALEGNLNELAKELGNPDKDNFEAPGKLLVKGSYRSQGIEGNSSSGAFITALRSDNHLSIVSYDTLSDCAVGPVRAYRSPARKDTENMSAKAADILMPVILDGGDEPDQLVFSDLNCKLSDVTLDTTSLPLSDTFAAKGGPLAQDAQAGVWYLDPRSGEKKLIADNAIPIASGSRVLFGEGPDGSRWMFTVEGGEVVGRDQNFKEVLRAGQDFDGLVYHKDARGAAVLIATREGNTFVSMPIEKPDEATTIAEHACSPKIYDGETARQFAWIDCDTATLMRYDYGEDKVIQIADDVTSYRIIDETDTGPLVMYVKQPDTEADAEIGPLYARWGEANAVFLGENGHLRLSWADVKGTQRPLVDWDADKNTGTLKYAAPGADLEDVAKGVVYVSSLGIISDYDGTNGKFSRLDDDKLTLVHKHVYPRGLRLDPDRDRERLLVAANFGEAGAELLLVSGESSVTSLMDNAVVDYYSFSLNANLVSVLTDADPDDGNVGTLRVVNIERGVSQAISDGVFRNALETTWPESGLLYSAPKADEPGLYFAKATR